MVNTPGFMAELADRDEMFGSLLIELFDQGRSDGALSMKTKTLMVLAMDAALGHRDGVRSLAQTAREHGASEDEILETIELVALICGIQGLGTASIVFEEAPS